MPLISSLATALFTAPQADMPAARVRSPLTVTALTAALVAFVSPACAQPTDAHTTLRNDIEFLAADALEGRATGSVGGQKARDYLVSRLGELGASPLLGESYVDTFPLRIGGKDVEAHNVVGVFPASLPKSESKPEAPGGGSSVPMLVLTAHYDHLGKRGGEIHNGADDNASGVSALLAIAARLKSTPTRHDVVIALLDAEELGLRGARHLAQRLKPQIEDITLNLNLDMVGRSDGGALFVAGTSHSPHLKPVVLNTAKTSTIRIELGHDTGSGSDNWTLASDHAAFHQLEVPFLYFGVEDHSDYHRPTDDSHKIDFDFLAAAVETVWSILLDVDAP